ncbi:MAG TPA: hypothetical protein DFS52_05320 [Myxococcales bacterium]|jgi:signal transduction histidine kinase|nr:hypothetical protein [Myxococcales bacterium]
MSQAVEKAVAPQPEGAHSERLSALFDVLPPGAEVCGLVFDPRLRVATASSGCEALFGRDVRSASVTELFRDFQAPKAEVATLDLLTRSVGRPKHVRVFWKQAARQVTALVIDLEAMSKGGHAVAAATARLASEVVHEGRNPLTTIKLTLQTLARSRLEGRLPRKVALAMREVRTSERIFSALSGLGRVSEPTEGVDLAEALEAAVSDMRCELDERGLGLRCELSLGEVSRRVDGGRLQLAVGQLIGLVGHGLEAGQVRLAATQLPGGVEILVEAEPAPSRRPSGAELSIELVRKIAAEHGGELIDFARGFRLTLAA